MTSQELTLFGKGRGNLYGHANILYKLVKKRNNCRYFKCVIATCDGSIKEENGVITIGLRNCLFLHIRSILHIVWQESRSPVWSPQ